MVNPPLLGPNEILRFLKNEHSRSEVLLHQGPDPIVLMRGSSKSARRVVVPISLFQVCGTPHISDLVRPWIDQTVDVSHCSPSRVVLTLLGEVIGTSSRSNRSPKTSRHTNAFATALESRRPYQ